MPGATTFSAAVGRAAICKCAPGATVCPPERAGSVPVVAGYTCASRRIVGATRKGVDHLHQWTGVRWGSGRPLEGAQHPDSRQGGPDVPREGPARCRRRLGVWAEWGTLGSVRGGSAETYRPLSAALLRRDPLHETAEPWLHPGCHLRRQGSAQMTHQRSP